MLIVGLTGGIGSGKSSVAHLFEEKGIPTIDTDMIARELTAPNEAAFNQIIVHFHDPALSKEGRLNRAYLREIIFKSPAEKKWLEALLHPLIQQKVEERIKALNAPYCIIVIPLLAEAGAYSFIQRILVVDAKEETQMARAKIRDELNDQQIKAIIKAQASRDERLKVAHDVIENNGALDELTAQVERLHHLYLSLSQ